MTNIAAKIAQVSANMEASTRVTEFGALARHLMLAKGGPALAWENARQQGNVTPRVLAVLKSGIAAGTTTDPAWAGGLADYNLLAHAFLGSLKEFSAFDAALADGAFKSVPLRTRVSVVTTGATGYLVSEGQAKPVSKLALANQVLDVKKAVAICAATSELLRNASPGALDLVTNELRRAVAVESDATFLNILTQTTDVYSEASTGMDAASFASDLASALNALLYGADARLYLVLSPAAAKAVAFMRDANGALYPGMTVRGGAISGIKVVVSDAVGDSAVLFDASQIAAASDTIVLDSSEQATLQLSDAPTDVATTVTSLWQSDMFAIRATRLFGVEVLRSSAVAVITGGTA